MQYSVDDLKAGRQLWQSELPLGPQATEQTDQAGCVGTPWMSELSSSGGGMACRQESAGAELLSVRRNDNNPVSASVQWTHRARKDKEEKGSDKLPRTGQNQPSSRILMRLCQQ